MDTLLVLRHAKASHDPHFTADIERPLTQRGRSDAQEIGRALSRIELIPDLVLCSPATRARETLDAVATAFPQDLRVQIEPTIYEANQGSEMLEVLRTLPNMRTVLLVGHNPVLAECVSLLACGVTSGVHFSTGALACLDVRGLPPDRLSPRTAELRWLLTPRVLHAL